MANIVISGVNLNRGDAVLLVAPEYMSDEELFKLKQELEYRFDGVKFVFLSGDFQLLGTYPADTLKVIEQ